MLRCVTAGLSALICAGPVCAQVSRPFPPTALRGDLVVVQSPDITLNGRTARLAPGARIRDENNMLQVSGALAGHRLTVNYTIDTSGLVFEVWILNAEERARRPWPTSHEQAAAWIFDASSQTWSRP